MKQHRAQKIKGVPDWKSIIKDELDGRKIKRVQEEVNTGMSMIVTGMCLAISKPHTKYL